MNLIPMDHDDVPFCFTRKIDNESERHAWIYHLAWMYRHLKKQDPAVHFYVNVSTRRDDTCMDQTHTSYIHQKYPIEYTAYFTRDKK